MQTAICLHYQFSYPFSLPFRHD